VRYDSLGRMGIFHVRDEEEHRARLKRVGHCFSVGLLPDKEQLVRSKVTVRCCCASSNTSVAFAAADRAAEQWICSTAPGC
jgi:hypothetical protein